MFRPALNFLKFTPISAASTLKLACKSDVINSTMFTRTLHLTSQDCKDRRDLRTYRMLQPKKDDGTMGEKSVDIDGIGEQKDLFPDVNTPERLFFGVPYKELPIFNIKSTKNNTIISLTDFKGSVHLIRSCGVDGFKNARKGTNIAAQTTAVAICGQALTLGVKIARVRVQGLGPGRIAAIKGLQMGGMNIVSITDNTHVSWNPPRPRKQRRI